MGRGREGEKEKECSEGGVRGRDEEGQSVSQENCEGRKEAGEMRVLVQVTIAGLRRGVATESVAGVCRRVATD